MSHVVLDGQGSLKYVFSLGTGTSDDPYRIVMQDYERALVDREKIFFHTDRHSLSNNQIFYYLIKTPASPAHVELLRVGCASTSSPINIDVYKDGIVSANGTAETLWNSNQQSSVAASTLLYVSPTVTDDGVNFISLVNPGEKSIGSALTTLTDGDRIILNHSTNYLLKFENVSGATALIGFDIKIGED